MPVGSALASGGGEGVVYHPIPPGQAWGFQFLYLKNITDHPITLESITLKGHGIGSTVEVVGTEVAPLPNADANYFLTYPPSIVFGEHRCWTDTLFPVRGYELRPGGLGVRIYFQVRSAKPGQFAVSSNEVRYSDGGTTYKQALLSPIQGSVEPGAEPFKLVHPEEVCVRGSVRLLSQSLGNRSN